MLKTIPLDIPFMLLSTYVNDLGDTEKRVLTPFGILDVTLRSLPTSDTHVPCFEIEVDGDTENWVSYDYVVSEFKSTLINFVLGIVERHWGKEARSGLKELSVHTKGAHLKIRMPWP
jgi:hypothetical protein